MAEVIGAVSAIAGLVEISGSVLCLGYSYISKVVRAPKEIRSLMGEIASLDIILDRLHDVAEDSNVKPDTLRTIESLSRLGTLDACSTLLKETEACIKSCETQDDGRDIKNLGRKMLWPLKEKQTKDMMQRLKDLRDTLTAALTVDSAAALRRIEASQTRIHSKVVLMSESIESEQKVRKHNELLKWLCPEDSKPKEALEAAIQSRQNDTCNWFFESGVFKSWIATDKASFWIYGIPGSGKTILSSAVIEHLKSSSFYAPNDAVVFYYSSGTGSAKVDSRHVLMTIASELARSSENCMDEVESLLQSKKPEERDNIPERDYLDVILAMSQHLRRLFVVVDGLDEMNDAERIVQCLQTITVSIPAACQFRLLVTSRNSLMMERIMLPLATSRLALHDHTGADILSYVTREVKRRLATRPPRIRDLEGVIVDEIVGRAGGLFLQTKLQIDYVCTLKTPGDIKAALLDFPNGLEPIYDRILEQITSQNPQDLDLIRRVLHWVLGARTAMPLDALAHAVALRLDDDTLDDDNVADADDLTEMCGSFIEINHASSGERTAKRAHLSVKEYFTSNHLSGSHLKLFHMVTQETHLELALICIKYLSLQELLTYVSNMPNSTDSWDSFHQKYPLYNYAAHNWETHVRLCRISKNEFESVIVPHLQWFMFPTEGLNHYFLWLNVVSWAPSRGRPLKGTDASLKYNGWGPPISYAIALELDHLFDFLFAGDPNEQLSNGHTLLTYAASTRNTSVAEKLLDLKADPDLKANFRQVNGMNPLHLAAASGSYTMTSLLLKRGASPDIPSNSGATAFYRAVRSGSLPIMRLLKDAGANINVRTWDNWTPVFEATYPKRIDALRLLLEWGAEADVPILQGGRTALSEAESRGYTKIIEILKSHANKSVTTDDTREV